MEVVSKGSEAHERDYSTKREEYLAFGIREYWIVDPVVRVVTILVRDGDVWTEQVFRDGQRATSSILPELAIETSALWAESESEADEKADEQEEGEA
jgi:Uma2 family endonuclease